MKTRSDFISNSSSCSFVIALDAGTSLDDFIEQAAKGCLKHVRPHEIEFSRKQDGLNKAVLGYHLRTSELLFLGELRVDDATRKIDRRNNPAEFDRIKRRAKPGGFCGNPEVMSEDEDSITLKFADFVGEIAVKSSEMPYITGNFNWRGDYSANPAEQKTAAGKIAEFARYYSDHAGIDYKVRSNSDTYFISRNTVWNTRALIAAGKDVVLDDWMDLDKIESALNGGALIFKVHVNNGGDGVDEGALYTFGGWEGEDLFDNMTGIDLLYSETM